ncbi:uncharacterized protein LOC131657648 [Vicia villosa]|uniref:uncharacterized protein LOC131657648 n=1 Tax=Vicia villosa TaxID=3911 RepID=UPI00273C6597|nr:uncharacterized protein LOC131657648 [Vicia villosa]
MVMIFVGKPKVCYFHYIADKVRTKLAAWKAKLLSMASRVQLVKSTILSMLIHCLSIYKLPGSIVKKIETWMRNFIGSDNIDKKKIVNVDWKSWSNLLKARVKRNGRIIKYSIKSSIWHEIQEAHGTVMENCMWSIGNGTRVNFWLDNWLGQSLASKFHIPEKFHFALTSEVSDWWINNSWSIRNNIQLAFPNQLHSIFAVTIPDVEIEDLFIWKNAKDGQLTLKEAYNTIIKPNPSTTWKSFP